MVDKQPPSTNGSAEGSGQINSIVSEEWRERERETFEEKLAEPLLGLVGHVRMQKPSNHFHFFLKNGSGPSNISFLTFISSCSDEQHYLHFTKSNADSDERFSSTRTRWKPTCTNIVGSFCDSDHPVQLTEESGQLFGNTPPKIVFTREHHTEAQARGRFPSHFHVSRLRIDCNTGVGIVVIWRSH